MLLALKVIGQRSLTHNFMKCREQREKHFKSLSKINSQLTLRTQRVYDSSAIKMLFFTFHKSFAHLGKLLLAQRNTSLK